MKHGNKRRWLGIVFLCTPLTALATTIAALFWHSQSATPDTAAPAVAGSIYRGTTTSFLGMALITIGCAVFLFSAFKHINRTKKVRKSRGVPVLFDRLDAEGIARLQKKISQVGALPRVPGRSYKKSVTVPDVFDEICAPVDEFDDNLDHADDRTVEWQQASSDTGTDHPEGW